jgi:hypothetical protein
VNNKQHDKKVIWALNKADEYLYTAWKHAEILSKTYDEINRAQNIIHKLIRAHEADE